MEFLVDVDIVLVFTLSHQSLHIAVVRQAEWVIESFGVNGLQMLSSFGLSGLVFFMRGLLLRFWSCWFGHEAVLVLEGVFTFICTIYII